MHQREESELILSLNQRIEELEKLNDDLLRENNLLLKLKVDNEINICNLTLENNNLKKSNK